MDSVRVVAVVPARYASTRLPGKPLVPLLGEPMIAHVVARVRESGACHVVLVATDDERIAAAARAAGAEAVMTGPARTGTDRVALAVRDIDADVVLNVQGDEPALPPANIRIVAEFLSARRDAPMATLALAATRDEPGNPNVVKVVCDHAGRALYFSRSPIPYPRNPGSHVWRKHIGLYGFQHEALLRFVAWEEGDLERCEGLEQLRALANGMAIHVLPAAGDSVAVDVPDDVPRAEAALARLAREGAGNRAQGTAGEPQP